mgnify:CR=1 FL=1
MWYTHNEHGGVFGISHDVGQQGMNRPMIRMRLKNLFFTGHGSPPVYSFTRVPTLWPSTTF